MQNTLAITSGRPFYQHLVLKLLSRMEKGTLYVELPTGEVLRMGDGSGGIAATIKVRSEAFFKACILYGDIGFGEAYVDGLWDTNDIGAVISWVLLNIDHAPGVSGNKTQVFLLNLMKGWNRIAHWRRANSEAGSRRNISEHYDLNNQFFQLFLDPTMTYSSGLFRDEETSLHDAQLAKYERLCRQLRLQAQDHVLEIGSGWGGNAIYMARQYGCRVTSVTISKEQYDFGVARVREAGLEDRVQILLMDYRHITGQYDKIVSIEMLEAVGHRYLDLYFTKCQSLLKHNGIFALQVITCPDSRYDQLRKGVDWIQKHIFPGSLLPSVAAINTAINRTSDLTMVDLKDMGLDYARTLQLWHRRFNDRLTEARRLGFDGRFVRKWNYYLCYCEAAFNMRNIHVMQLVYTRPNNTLR